MRNLTLSTLFAAMTLCAVCSTNAFAFDGVRLVDAKHHTSFLTLGESRKDVEKTLRDMGSRWTSWTGEKHAWIKVNPHFSNAVINNPAFANFNATTNSYAQEDSLSGDRISVLKLNFSKNADGKSVLSSYKIVKE